MRGHRRGIATGDTSVSVRAWCAVMPRRRAPHMRRQPRRSAGDGNRFIQYVPRPGVPPQVCRERPGAARSAPVAAVVRMRHSHQRHTDRPWLVGTRGRAIIGAVCTVDACPRSHIACHRHTHTTPRAHLLSTSSTAPCARLTGGAGVAGVTRAFKHSSRRLCLCGCVERQVTVDM